MSKLLRGFLLVLGMLTFISVSVVGQSVEWSGMSDNTTPLYGIDGVNSPDGGIVVLTKSISETTGFAQFYLIKFTPNDEFIWENSYGDDVNYEPTGMVQTYDGGFLLYGSKEVPGKGFDIYLIRTDAGGVELWNKTYGNLYDDFIYDMIETSDSGFVGVGEIRLDSPTDVYGLGFKFDPNGDSSGVLTYGNGDNAPYDHYSFSSIVLDAPYMYIGGRYDNDTTGVHQLACANITEEGNEQWMFTYSSADDMRINDIEVIADGTLIAGGYFQNGTTSFNGFILNLNAAGDSLWMAEFIEPTNQTAIAILPEPDSGFMILATDYDESVDSTISGVMKIDQSINEVWSFEFDSTYRHCLGAGMIRMYDGGLVFAGTVIDDVFGTQGYAARIVLGPDVVDPDPISDLVAFNPTDTSAELSWTSVGDDGLLGDAIDYEIRYNTVMIDAGNWNSSTPVGHGMVPQIGGNPEGIVVYGLEVGTIYYFGIVTSDEVGNTSMSNISMATTTGATGITELESQLLPDVFSLSQNYPNPFNPQTNINFSLPENVAVKLEIININGQQVETLVNKNMKAGVYSVSWDGAQYASGVYLYRLTAGDFVETKQMVLIK